MEQQFAEAIDELSRDKGIEKDDIIQGVCDTVTEGIRSDFDVPPDVTINVKVNPEDGSVKAGIEKKVVDEITDPLRELTTEQAEQFDHEAKVGDTIQQPVKLDDLSRTTTQRVLASLRKRIDEDVDMDRYNKYKDSVGELFNGIIQRKEEQTVYVLLDDQAEAILPAREQVDNDDYRSSNRMKFVLVKVKMGDRGLSLVVSRSTTKLVRRLFELHVPEIHNGILEIVDIVREAGNGSKIIIDSNDPEVDPIGTCVGQGSSRITSIQNELGGEPIDIIPFTNDSREIVRESLSPAEITRIHEEDDEFHVIVPDDQVGMAIGKNGYNIRLTSKLIDKNVEVFDEQEYAARNTRDAQEVAAKLFGESEQNIELTDLDGVGAGTADTLTSHDYTSVEDILEAGADKLSELSGIGTKTASQIVESGQEMVQTKLDDGEEGEKEEIDEEKTKQDVESDIFKD